MKKWTEYGAEHSEHLKIVAEFKSDEDLRNAVADIEEIKLRAEQEADKPATGEKDIDLYQFLFNKELGSITNNDLMSFLAESKMNIVENTLVIESRESLPALWEFLHHRAIKVTTTNGETDE